MLFCDAELCVISCRRQQKKAILKGLLLVYEAEPCVLHDHAPVDGSLLLNLPASSRINAV